MDFVWQAQWIARVLQVRDCILRGRRGTSATANRIGSTATDVLCVQNLWQARHFRTS